KPAFSEGAVISSKTGKAISFEELIDELSKVRVIFIGEKHTLAAHHEVQLAIIKRMYLKDPDLLVGMEMFDRSYQGILEQWRCGKLEQKDFLQKTHWYANWKYDFALYSDILDYIKRNHIRLIGLNIPFHIPPKIAVGGIDALLPEEKRYLPKQIDTSNASHRAYVQQVFSEHRMRGRQDFEHFYQAQCVWEEIMAETIAENLGGHRMIVLAGNGHIIHKFGIPDRVVRRKKNEIRTIYLLPAGTEAELSIADYIWVTSSR
ncbi:protein containing DUF399, partial [sediment metagenome]